MGVLPCLDGDRTYHRLRIRLLEEQASRSKFRSPVDDAAFGEMIHDAIEVPFVLSEKLGRANSLSAKMLPEDKAYSRGAGVSGSPCHGERLCLVVRIVEHIILVSLPFIVLYSFDADTHDRELLFTLIQFPLWKQ